jgi:hypothetical protein
MIGRAGCRCVRCVRCPVLARRSQAYRKIADVTSMCFWFAPARLNFVPRRNLVFTDVQEPVHSIALAVVASHIFNKH